MDWIEKLFGISPDGGNGATEMLFMAAALAIVVLLLTFGQRVLSRHDQRRRSTR